MKQFPFTDYDFWGYLSAGFLFLFALDFSLSANLIIKREYTIAEAVIAFSSAYIVGHLIAGLSSAVLERRLGRIFGNPINHLVGDSKVPRWGAFVFPSFFEKLPPSTLAALNAKRSANEDTRSLFQKAHRATLKDAKASERMASFLNQYGFCRNTSFSALCSAGAFTLCAHHTDKPQALLFAIFSGIVSIGMYFRYLKYNRLFANEVLASYAYQKD